ncbi:predicted protein [Histoplasma capsulatum G186AR]|uniref:Uncharacterized protein n=1 Tax=Ajellomyces capsulatus (strain G186AR / H82 / ATCC MYA-2454 / RMSCC 2432) TaxID=447093 RepID=C0NWK9_AJECG|nr:uncharacterized protein HCBG_07539 [Histoplasma capsulatum G186AR]EEH04314.1 predicted protein [Histoplasma capsulatum G186AR]
MRWELERQRGKEPAPEGCRGSRGCKVFGARKRRLRGFRAPRGQRRGETGTANSPVSPVRVPPALAATARGANIHGLSPPPPAYSQPLPWYNTIWYCITQYGIYPLWLRKGDQPFLLVSAQTCTDLYSCPGSLSY